MTYAEKLKDPRWQKKRLEILERDDFRCQKCGDEKTTVHVHHRIYKKDLDPWLYDDNELITLCEDCHNYETEHIYKAIKALISAVKLKFFSDGIVALAKGIDEMEGFYSPEVEAEVIGFSIKDRTCQKYMENKYFEDLKEKWDAKKIH